MSPLRFPTLQCRQVGLSGIAIAAMLLIGNSNVFAQPILEVPDSPALSRPAPPVPIDARVGKPSTTPSNIVPPMSVGPVPNYAPYPNVGTTFDGRQVYIAPPVYGPPVYAGPAYGVSPYGPPAPAGPVGRSRGLSNPQPPVPINSTVTNYPPVTIQQGVSPQGNFPQAPRPIEVRRASGPANIRFTVGETFLNRVIAQDRVEPGPVRDNILGAQVTGRQTTMSRLRVDLLPSNEQARIALLLRGDVQTLTTGVTPQAMIDTAGQQQFSGVKEVYFDGERFSTRHATVYIRANNQTIGATTGLSGTMFGGLADRIAYRVAERQKSAGEAVARDRLAERLFPTFDGEVDERLAQANRSLEPVRRWLDTMKLLPSSQSTWTTDQQLIYEGLVGDSKNVTSLPAADQIENDNGLRISIHESLTNTFIDRTGLKGLKTTDKKLREMEYTFLRYTGQNVPDDAENSAAVPGMEGIVTDIEFDEVDPMTIRYDRDQAILTIKAQFKPAGQALMPPMVVTIPYQIQVAGDKLRFRGQTPTVVTQDRPDPDAPPTIIERAIQKVIEADLIPLEFDRTLPASLWKGPGPAPRISSIKADNGWLTITAE